MHSLPAVRIDPPTRIVWVTHLPSARLQCAGAAAPPRRDFTCRRRRRAIESLLCERAYTSGSLVGKYVRLTRTICTTPSRTATTISAWACSVRRRASMRPSSPQKRPRSTDCAGPATSPIRQPTIQLQEATGPWGRGLDTSIRRRMPRVALQMIRAYRASESRRFRRLVAVAASSRLVAYVEVAILRTRRFASEPSGAERRIERDPSTRSVLRNPRHRVDVIP
jgi:hypothetical protein